MRYHFAELVDIEKIQKMMDLLYDATNVLTAVLDLKGNILTSSGWRSICIDFHRKNHSTQKRCGISDCRINERLKDGEKYVIYYCENGLIDAATRIFVHGEHVANVYTGQFLLEEPDMMFFRQQAKLHGFDEEQYVEALGNVPIYSEEKVKRIMEYLCSQAEMLGEMGYQEMETRRAAAELRDTCEELENTKEVLTATLEELRDQYDELQKKEMIARQHEELWEHAIEGTGLIIYDWNLRNNQLYFTRTFKSLLGFEATEFIGDREKYLRRIHPDDQQKVKEKTEEVLTGKTELYNNEYRIKNKEEKYMWVQVKGKIVERNQNNQPLRLVGTLMDITHYKKKEGFGGV
ncbi:PAS domain S-box-containing protein [Tindallia magadiensis]|uniref:histidine kinase n=1 Tax=Tindallia magadiensis TaxID=69895 RepID=A0A1I3BAF9_9FIRM|nr:PocR ligand-binding domain-containing protein [Tindallia magadiensis]SFH59232.1 PAS domain S-box-containing protein [Tindallia magadiensis]